MIALRWIERSHQRVERLNHCQHVGLIGAFGPDRQRRRGHGFSAATLPIASSRMSSARLISASVVVSGGVRVSTLPNVVLNESPFSSARYITASAAAFAGALLTREVTSSIPSKKPS